MIRNHNRTQYKALTEPLSPLVAVAALPAIDWLVQSPDPIRRNARVLATGEVSVPRVTIGLPPIDWLVQQLDPLPRRTRQQATGETRTEVAIVSAPLLDIDWLVQDPDPLPKKFVMQVVGSETRVDIGIPPPVLLPVLDWLVQNHDPLPRRTNFQATGALLVEPVAPAPSPFWGGGTTVIYPSRVIHYKALTEPLPPLVAVAPLDPIDWLVQPLDPVRPPRSLVRSTGETRTEVPIIPLLDMGWLIQDPDPLPKPVRFQTVGETRVEIRKPVLNDIDWLYQPLDPVRLPPRALDTNVETPQPPVPLPPIDWLVQQPQPRSGPRQTEYPSLTFVEDFVAAPALLDWGWFVQYPDPLPKPVRFQVAGETRTEVDILPVAPLDPIDWLIQDPDPLPKRVRFSQTGNTLVEEFVAAAPLLDMGWLIQQPDPQPKPIRFQVTGETRAEVDIVPVVLDPIDWLVQPLDPIRPETRIVPQALFLVEDFVAAPAALPPIDWLVQNLDPIPKPLRIVQAGEFRTDVAALPPVDWLVQALDPIRRRPQAPFQNFQVEPPPLPLPAFDWFVQQLDPIRRKARAVDEAQHLTLIDPVPLLPPLDWFVQYPDPVRPKVRITEQMFTDPANLLPIITFRPFNRLTIIGSEDTISAVGHTDPTRTVVGEFDV